MSTVFTKLNVGWNAEPNAPNPQIALWEGDLVLSFHLNSFVYPQFEEGDIGQLRFRNTWRYRLGPVNDEGWHRGQCRFSKSAPGWGEFYEIHGDLLLEVCPADWVEMGLKMGWKSELQKHFLFYLRDQTFECDADSWSFSVLRQRLGGI